MYDQILIHPVTQQMSCHPSSTINEAVKTAAKCAHGIKFDDSYVGHFNIHAVHDK